MSQIQAPRAMPASWPREQAWIPYLVGVPLIPGLLTAFIPNENWLFPLNIFQSVSLALWGSQRNFQILMGICFSLHIIESCWTLWFARSCNLRAADTRAWVALTLLLGGSACLHMIREERKYTD